jgi:magnesium chelatase family protein
MFKDLLSRCLGLSQPNETHSQDVIIQEQQPLLDIGQIRGQEEAKIRLLLAAIGRHDVLMIGPPGEGKTTLARSMPGFLSPLDAEEYEVLCDVYKDLPGRILPSYTRPFVETNPTTRESVLLGGGLSKPIPGLISQASGGILFMDEIIEFDRKMLDTLRQPMSRGWIAIERRGKCRVYPCRFQLIAACNPCPCGYFGDSDDDGNNLCTCRPHEVHRYQRKLSGPLLDRIDMVIPIDRITVDEQLSPPIENESYRFSQLVRAAQGIRESRVQGFTNNEIPDHEAVNPSSQYMRWSANGLRVFREYALDDARFSSRRRGRFAKVARTVADSVLCESIESRHVEKAYEVVNEKIIQ